MYRTRGFSFRFLPMTATGPMCDVKTFWHPSFRFGVALIPMRYMGLNSGMVRRNVVAPMLCTSSHTTSPKLVNNFLGYSRELNSD